MVVEGEQTESRPRVRELSARFGWEASYPKAAEEFVAVAKREKALRVCDPLSLLSKKQRRAAFCGWRKGMLTGVEPHARGSHRFLKTDLGAVGLGSFLTEIEKLKRIRAVGLPTNLLEARSSKLVKTYRHRAESRNSLSPQTTSPCYSLHFDGSLLYSTQPGDYG